MIFKYLNLRKKMNFLKSITQYVIAPTRIYNMVMTIGYLIY